MSGRYDDVFVIKKKMCFSGGYIQKLEIDTASRTVSGQPGPPVQAEGSAAAYDQRPGFVFEVYYGIVQVSGIYVHGQFLHSILVWNCRKCLVSFADSPKKTCVILCMMLYVFTLLYHFVHGLYNTVHGRIRKNFL